jgi:hypothetical protein
MKKILLVLGVVCFSACAQHQPQLNVGPFASYVQAFQEAGASQGKEIKINDLVMQFSDISNTEEAGDCQFTEGETPVININSQDWGAMDEGKRTALVFHELGHCILHRVHRPGTNDEGIPVSVMNPYTIDGTIYLPNAAYYTQELFSEENQF